MTNRPRVVLDTNVLVSGLISPGSTPGQAFRKAIDTAHVLASDATLMELARVLARPKFDRYISVADRQELLRFLVRLAVSVPIVYPVRVCRDPKDDILLELAVNGRANHLVTGDLDLLALSKIQSTPILTHAAYLALP